MWFLICDNAQLTQFNDGPESARTDGAGYKLYSTAGINSDLGFLYLYSLSVIERIVRGCNCDREHRVILVERGGGMFLSFVFFSIDYSESV